MAAYAAVQSLMRLLEGIMDADPSWVFHDKLQIELLQEKISALSHFLEEYSVPANEVVRDLEIKIRDIAYNAEDIIETYVSDQLLSVSDEEDKELIYQTFCRDLEIAMEEISRIQEEAMAIRGRILELNSLQQRNRLSVDRSKLMSSGKNTTVVGFDDELIKIKDWITSSSPKLEVTSVVGMGGIGKTTLARNVFDGPLVVYHFDIRSWVTVSQEYKAREIFAGLLRHLTSELRQEGEEKLAEHLYKSLKGRRYLIVMDDLWETKAWDDIKRFFPDDNNGSRIILTTRLTGVGVHAASDNRVLNLSFLSLSESWNLLCQKVFGEESCPHYLVEVGKEIATCCRGLPLSIVVVGGLLSMDKTVGYWATMATSMSSLLAMDDGQCSKILSISYNHLPIQLKPCFLYFAVFPEDYEIRRSKLVRLWVAEGFLEPDNSNRLEDIAETYLEDLVNRSLIMVSKRGYCGKVKTYKIHDLLRDFCIKEAQKEKFLHVINSYAPSHREAIHSERRVSIHRNIPFDDYIEDTYKANGPAVLARSLQLFYEVPMIKLPVGFRLLKVLDMTGEMQFGEFSMELVNLVHLKCLFLGYFFETSPYNLTLVSSLWSLQTLVILGMGVFISLPLAVWKMPYLRHLQINNCCLPDPPFTNFVTLANLQTLAWIGNFRLTDEAVRRLPRLKKLRVSYDVDSKDWPHYHLSNIVCLNELEILTLHSNSPITCPANFKLPWSLKRLKLSGCSLPWEDLTIAGSLPNLEVLKLRNDACEGGVWEPNEGEFRELKVLKLCALGLGHLRADDSHFPKLKHLTISLCSELKEIPFEIGNIQTLELIELDYVNPSVKASAKLILDEQRSFGNDDLQIRIKGKYHES